MKKFANVLLQLEQKTHSGDKIAVIADYLRDVSPACRDCAMYLLAGGKFERIASATEIKVWGSELAEIPMWLLEESCRTVGDVAETVALILPPPDKQTDRLLETWCAFIDSLNRKPATERQRGVFDAWGELSPEERFVFNKLITGSPATKVSKTTLARAIAQAFGFSPEGVAHWLSGLPTRAVMRFDVLLRQQHCGAILNPLPFQPRAPLEVLPESLGRISSWQIEYAWDGLRAQVVRRGEEVAVWSEEGEHLVDCFPEIVSIIEHIPSDTILDGEFVAWHGGPAPFSLIQNRLGRKRIPERLLREAPVVFLASDLLESAGIDIRREPLKARREKLERMVVPTGPAAIVQLSPILQPSSWEELHRLRASCRENRAVGVCLKRMAESYAQSPENRWLLWESELLSIDGVLMYAERNKHHESPRYADFTFGVWSGEELVPFTKAFEGLSTAELEELVSFIKANSIERFGPVESIEPKLVFQISFMGLSPSSRRRSGVAVHSPRISKWHREKRSIQAGTLEELRTLLNFVHSV